MPSMGVSGGLRAGVRSFLCLMVCCWAVLAVCGAESSFGQRLSAPPPESSGPFSAAGIGTGTRAISGLWQFHLGDDPARAQPGFDDHGWEQLPADQPWGDVGHPGYAGYAWYRRQITLDPTDKTPLAVLLPPLDAVAEVYWNGVKVGSERSMPPHPSWFYTSQPVAISLPPDPGARTGVLAIRLWERFLDDADAPDAGGLQAAPVIGYRPVIEKLPDAWSEHHLHTMTARNDANLLILFVSTAALVLWIRSPRQWVLLCVGLYFGAYSVAFLLPQFLSLPWIWGQMVQVFSMCTRIFSLGLILFLADLPERPGVKGFRFWAGACLAMSCLIFVGTTIAVRETVILQFHPSDLSGFAEFLSRMYEYGLPIFQTTQLGV